MRLFRQQQSGAVMVLVALSLVVLIAAAGLALDSGRVYIVKSKLNAAVDSAALAAARAVPQGTSQAEQMANATIAARKFFVANYGSSYMGSTATMSDPTYLFESGKVTIDVNATAPMPVTLMGVLGFTTVSPSAHAQTIRKDLDMALVLDNSGSLSGSAAGVRSSAITFLNQFDQNQDRVALMRFAYGAIVDYPIKTTGRGFDRASMTASIKGFGFNGSTASSEGMWNARNQLNGIELLNRSSMRVIVFFSDGAPNSFASFFPFKTASDCTTAGTMTTPDDTSASDPGGLYDIGQMDSKLGGKCYSSNSKVPIATTITQMPAYYTAHDKTSTEFPVITSSPRTVTSDLSTTDAAWRNVNRASRNLAEAIASKARDEGIYIFTLGLGSQLKSGTGPDKETGESVLKCLANTTDARANCYNPKQPIGMYCYAATSSDLSPCFTKLASAILRISK